MRFSTKKEQTTTKKRKKKAMNLRLLSNGCWSTPTASPAEYMMDAQFSRVAIYRGGAGGRVVMGRVGGRVQGGQHQGGQGRAGLRVAMCRGVAGSRVSTCSRRRVEGGHLLEGQGRGWPPAQGAGSRVAIRRRGGRVTGMQGFTHGGARNSAASPSLAGL